MKKNYQIHRIRARSSYSCEELACILHTHPQTVRIWRKKGLTPLEGSHSPLLFCGADVKAFLTKQMKKRKVTLQSGEMYCLRCKAAVQPISAQTHQSGTVLGNGHTMVVVSAECPTCSCQLRKFGSQQVEESKEAVVINREPAYPSNPSHYE